ncbi:PepSY domain-containing protein [Rhodobacter sp. SY28-1]|uniref:PepSY domain-containing protein n=1 Tax=Rhodobacter sp. SY28-1 TaxID=2562317 RepID=UPI00148543CB|nr:PepSY domain-containing protein [Rhodobacter sp. SY28-1]
MKLRTRLLCYAAAIALTSGAAFSAIDGNQLAEDYLAAGYDFVEVKVGPTQTKVEAIRDGIKVEVIYDNETLAILKKESEAADDDDADRTGKQVKTVDSDFDDEDDDQDDDRKGRDDDDEDDDDDDDDDDGDDDRGGDDDNDDSDDDDGDDSDGDDD